MNVWWQKIFDLFVVGDYLHLILWIILGLKDFLSGLGMLLWGALC